MKIDTMEGDKFLKCKSTMWQVRGNKFRWIGHAEWESAGVSWPVTEGNMRESVTIEDARKNAESLGHELVMPEEKGPFCIRGGQNDEIRSFATKAGRSQFLAFADLKYLHCTYTGEVIQ